jgi:hypothetical protein
VKCDMTHYKELKEDKHFKSWNRGIIATAHMNHTHLVLDANYSLANANDVALFKEMQTCMYAVLQEHLKTDKVKLVSHFGATRAFWKFGLIVPRTHAQAIELDKKNNTTRWQEAEATEMGQLLEYESFVDKGIAGNVPSVVT